MVSSLILFCSRERLRLLNPSSTRYQHVCYLFGVREGALDSLRIQTRRKQLHVSSPVRQAQSLAARSHSSYYRLQATGLTAQSYRKVVTTARRDKKAGTGPKGLTEEQKQEIRCAKCV